MITLESFHYITEEIELPKFTSDKYLIYWIKLCNKASVSLNIVSNRLGKSVFKSMTITEIQKYLSISERTWFRFVKEAKLNSSILLFEGMVYLNPRYNFNMWNINRETIKLFKEYDDNFVSFIHKYNLEYTYEVEPFELINEKCWNKISPTLYKILAGEKHSDKFDYSMTEYKGMKDKIEVFCNTHQHKFEVIAENHLNSNGGCPLCAFEHRAYTYYELPTIFYIIKVENLYKIGITTGSIKQRYKGEKVAYDTILVKEYSSGKEAHMLEQWCLSNFRDYKYKGNSPFNNTGNSEIFIEDISKHPEFIRRIDGQQ